MSLKAAPLAPAPTEPGPPGIGSNRIIAALAVVVFVAALLRLAGPGRWPIFLDEDQHAVAAAQLPAQPSAKAALAFAARETGKPPLMPVLLWAFAPAFGDTLTAGRILSGLAGTATVALCFLLGLRLRDSALGLQAALLYAVCPWAVLHERLAIHDGLLTLAMLVTLWTVWRAAECGTFGSALLAAGAASITVHLKQPGILVVILPILAFVLTRAFRWPALGRAVFIATAPILNLVLLSVGPFRGMTESQSGRLQPLLNLGGNLRGLIETTSVYLPLGLGAILILGVVLGLRDRTPFGAYLSLAFVAWALPWPFAGPFAPSRYYLPAIPLVCILAPFSFQWIAEHSARGFSRWRIAGRLYGAAVALVMATQSLGMVRNLATARLPELDAFQYQGDWPAGFGLREACAYVFERAEPGAQIVPVMHPRHQLVCGGVNPPRRDVTVVASPDFRTEIRLEPYSSALPVYFVVDDSPGGSMTTRIHDADPRIAIDRAFPRPGGRSTVFVLRRAAALAR